MALLDWLGICAQIGPWLLYLMFYGVFTVLRNLVWRCTGTYRELCDSNKPDNYDRSAHVMTIIFSYRLDMFIEARIMDFCAVHESFVSPEFVLRDDVNLMQISPTQAIFVQQKPGSKPIESFPFAILGIHDAPLKLITMPLASFTKLAESIPKTPGKVVFLHNEARCGGTLFVEIFKATGRCITYGEPHVINSVVKYHYNESAWTRNEMLQHLRNVTRVLCKPRDNKPDTLAYIIKPTSVSIICADAIQEALPDAVQFFIYRDPITVAISLRRVAAALVSLNLVYYLPNIPNMSSKLLELNGYCGVDFRKWTPRTGMEMAFGFRGAVVTVMRYLRYREIGVDIHGVRYEPSVANQEKVTGKIFDLCGLPKSLVREAMGAFRHDSQGASPISREILKKLNPNPPKPYPEFIAEATEMCQTLNIPDLSVWTDTDYLLPGSVQP